MDCDGLACVMIGDGFANMRTRWICTPRECEYLFNLKHAGYCFFRTCQLNKQLATGTLVPSGVHFALYYLFFLMYKQRKKRNNRQTITQGVNMSNKLTVRCVRSFGYERNSFLFLVSGVAFCNGTSLHVLRDDTAT